MLQSVTVVAEHLCCPTGIQKLVLAGRVGEAIQVTQQLYPGLLEHNPNLLFVLKLVNITHRCGVAPTKLAFP